MRTPDTKERFAQHARLSLRHLWQDCKCGIQDFLLNPGTAVRETVLRCPSLLQRFEANEHRPFPERDIAPRSAVASPFPSGHIRLALFSQRHPLRPRSPRPSSWVSRFGRHYAGSIRLFVSHRAVALAGHTGPALAALKRVLPRKMGMVLADPPQAETIGTIGFHRGSEARGPCSKYRRNTARQR